MASPSDMSQEGSAKKTTFDELTKEELITKCKNLLVIAQKAKQAKTDYHNEAENQKVRYEKCESEKKVLEDNFKTLQELVDSLTEQKLTFITEIDTANNKVRQLTGKCQEYEEELEKYKAELLLKDKAILESKQKLSDFDSEIISLKRQNNRLLEENEQLITQLSELEAKVAEFNSIGLQQHEQLQTLEETISNDTNKYKIEIEDLHSTILKLQAQINTENSSKNYDDKINELTQLYENEVGKNEKANIKLKCYRDKILKCASCISQLKNSRFILAKTVKEYSENIPKWQNDIINASKVLERQLNELNEENISLKQVIVKLNSDISNMKGIELNEKRLNELNLKATTLESELLNVRKENEILLANYNASKEENCILQQNYTELSEVKLPTLTNENVALNSKVAELKTKIDTLTSENGELILTVSDLTSKNKTIQGIINSKVQNNDIENLNLQLKALESEKAILVREKLTARDSIVELENQNKLLNNQIDQMKNNIQQMKAQLEQISQDQINNMKDRDDKVNSLRSQEKSFQDQYNILKKEYEGLQDLNTLLKEEVETLKLSLEQPADDSENMSESNMSMQADFVKLETKLSNYKQENASLLAEMKESRAKIKEAENILSEFEEAKSKLASYKSENNELLTEMKEINQALKERGEAISKLQKAVSESERLIETLEKERENSMSEKEDLLKKYRALENEHKSAEQKASDSNKINNQIIAEKDEALKCLKEKEAIIVSLNEEIEKLKQQQSSVAELPNDDNMSTSTISRADDQNRMKDLDDTFEDKYTKLRIFALKLKKKLNDTVIQLENAEKDKAKLEKTINEAPAASVDQVDSHQSTQRESKITDLEEKVKMLTANVSQSEELTDELEKLKVELSSKSQQLAAEIEAHKVTRDNLDKAKREVKKKSVLSLEMEDYERSMKELTSKMEENKKKIVQMESTIDTQEGTIVAMKTQIKLLEEQIKSEETQSRLLKEELRRLLDESKDKDMEINSKNDTISKLEQDIEVEKRRNEEADLELTSVIGEKEKIIMILGDEKTELNSKLKRVEFKCAELNEKLRIANIELDDLKAEYTSYKVRAQSVLRQNQTVDHSQEEQIKEELAALKAQMDTVVAKLNSATEQNDDLKSELSSCARRAAESAGEVSRAQQRTARLQSDLTRLSQQLDSERTQHKLQISTLTQCYKAQIVDLEAQVQEVDTLKSQLATLKESQSKASVVEDANRNPAPYMLPVIPKEDGSDGEMDINVSMIPREDGEGSEFAPSPPLSKSFMSGGNARRSPMPLERLLEEGVPDDEAMDVSSLGLTPEQEIADLRRKLLAQVQRVKHVTVLLSESERECARMSQLSELLKSELRRARGTSQTTHNTEYMKNVTFKFLTLPPGDERGRLVPVLQKILTLTPEETNKIHAVAKGQDPNSGRGWGSYLPWPAGKST